MVARSAVSCLCFWVCRVSSRLPPSAPAAGLLVSLLLLCGGAWGHRRADAAREATFRSGLGAGGGQDEGGPFSLVPFPQWGSRSDQAKLLVS